jgi:DNA-binding NtrC family response regulator
MEDRKGNILVIDDDPDIRVTARMILKKHFGEVVVWEHPELLRERGLDGVDLVLLDMNFSPGATSGEEGMQWLQEIGRRYPDLPVVMITAYGDINLAVKAMKLGAVDFVVKPWENQKFLATVRSACRLGQSRQEVRRLRSTTRALQSDMDQPYGDIVGESPAMKEVFQTVDKIATTDVNVLILGENGTGKELVAREVHRRSERAGEVFMHVDLGALSETLFESELFGHVKGAFTDAKDDRKGRFEMADRGSLFLDEIGNLSMPLQSKLLTAIQRKEITRVGSSRIRAVNVRLICATNMPLKDMVADEIFREDLLYRINTVEILLPPLRERLEDLPLLVEHFLRQFRKKYRKPRLVLTNRAMEKLQGYAWPGNIRELQHILERTVIMSEGNEIQAKDLVIDSGPKITSLPSTLNLEAIEKDTILKALRKHQYNLSAAAKELGLGRTTLYRKMNKYER